MTQTAVPLASSYDEMISATWLTNALRERYPDVEIARVDIVDTLHGVGTKAILEVEYAAGGEHLPSTLCAKAGWEPENAHILKGGTYAREARFYGELAPLLEIQTPRCYYAGYDADSGQGIVVLENLRAAGITFGSALIGFDVDQAARFMEEFALLHARFWDRAGSAHPWLQSPPPGAQPGAGDWYASRVAENLAGSRADSLPGEMRDSARLLAASTALSALDPARNCVVHGDAHAGNLFLSADGRPGYYDWQTTRAGHWATDVAYFLGATLDHEDRQKSVQDLLRHYLEHLRAHVGDGPTWDEAWLAYRRYLVYGFYLWAITRPLVQPIEVITAFMDRLGHAAAEAESYTVLGV